MNTEWKYWKGIVLASTVALLYSEGAGGALRLEDLERMALDNNPTIAQAAAGIRAAEGRTLQAGLYPNPIMGYIGEEISGRAPRTSSRTSEKTSVFHGAGDRHRGEAQPEHFLRKHGARPRPKPKRRDCAC